MSDGSYVLAVQDRVVWADFEAHAAHCYKRGLDLLRALENGTALGPDDNAAAMRASYTRQRLMNERLLLQARPAESDTHGR